MIYHSGTGGYGNQYNLDGLAQEIERTVAGLRGYREGFDGLVVQGLSGIIPAVPVSLALNVPLFIVRKESDDCHAYTRYINADKVKPGSRWVFLDDFISTGSTLRRVLGAVRDLHGTIVASYETREHELTWAHEPSRMRAILNEPVKPKPSPKLTTDDCEIPF